MFRQLDTGSIEKHSRNLAMIFAWAFWIAALWLFADVSYVPLKRFGASLVTPDRDALESALAFGDAMIGFLPVIFALCAVYTARGLFVQFSRGEIFTPRNGKSLTRVGDWLIASAMAALFVTPTIRYMSGSQAEDIGASYILIVLVLVGLAVRLFGRTFSIAADIKAENDQMV